MKKTQLSIIIVSWNVKDYLKACLESILGTVNSIEFEIFIVDNNSNDGTVEFVKERFPQVNIIANKDNLGFAKANNQAITKSHGEYVLLLNPDTIVFEGAIKKMIDRIGQDQNIGVLGPKIITGDGRTISYCGGRKFPSVMSIVFGITTLDRYSRFFDSHSMKYWDHADSREVDAISGSCMLIRRKTIQGVGMLDESFFMYAEDIDWCYRIKKSGWDIYYYAAAEIMHYGEKSACQKFTEVDNALESLKTYYVYFKKHKGKLYARAYKVTLVLVLFGMNVLWLVALLAHIKKRELIEQIMSRNREFIKWGANSC